MTTKQISVFLENKTGRLNEVTKALAAHDINMQAFCIAETTDFGLMRLIVQDADHTAAVLRDAGFAVILTDVIQIHCPNVPGALSKILESLAEDDSAEVIINPNNLLKCLEVLKRKHPEIL